MWGAHSGHCILLPFLMLKNAFKKHPLQNRTNVQKNCTFLKGGLPLTDSSEDFCARLWLIVCKRFSHLVVEFRLWRRKCKPGGEWVEYFNNFLSSTLFASLRCWNPLQYLLDSPFVVANRLWTQRPLLRSLEQQIRSKMLLRR